MGEQESVSAGLQGSRQVGLAAAGNQRFRGRVPSLGQPSLATPLPNTFIIQLWGREWIAVGREPGQLASYGTSPDAR